MLGFQLDENEVITKGQYYVKLVEIDSASAMAGLKQGDKITKINGKSTLNMTYDQFCAEIVYAQQQQQKNNMIHLMVMRRSSKTHGTSSYSLSGTATSGSTLTGTNNTNMNTNLTVFISNLSFEVEESKVRAVFEKV